MLLSPMGLNVQPSEFNPSVAKETFCDRDRHKKAFAAAQQFTVRLT